MQYSITKNQEGKPVHVYEENSFMSISRPFDEEKDGWMLDQLDYNDFPMIRHGQDMEYLVSLVNKLKRENFHLKKQVEDWRKATGFQ